MTRCRCIIHGNITNKPLTRWAALRGPRRTGRADFANRVDFEGRTDFADRADFADRFEVAADFLAGLVERFFVGRFLVAITYLPQDFQAIAQLGHAPTEAPEPRRFRPSQKATA